MRKDEDAMEHAKKTPLYEKHAAAGASFGESGGLFLPKNYGNPEKEAETARKSVSGIDISGRGKLLLSGKDHIRFLQGMLTNDVESRPPGTGAYAAVLTPKGKMISDMRVLKNENSIYMDTEPGSVGVLKDLLTRFRLSYRAEITDASRDFCVLHLCGPESGDFVAKRLGIGTDEMKEYDHEEAAGAVVAKLNRTGETGFDIIFETSEAERVWDILAPEMETTGLAGSDALEVLRIEAGIPVYGKDMDSSTIPIEAGIWSALDFEKGCYVGQEVIARIRWRGRVNWHLACFAAKNDCRPAPGNILVSGEKKIGRITSSAYSDSLGKSVAIGYIRREFREFDGEIAVSGEKNGGDGKTSVRMLKKPARDNFR